MEFQILLFLFIFCLPRLNAVDTCGFRVERTNTTLYYFLHEECDGRPVEMQTDPYFDYFKTTCNQWHSNSFEILKMGSCSENTEYGFLLIERDFWKKEPENHSILLQWKLFNSSIFGSSKRATIEHLRSITADAFIDGPGYGTYRRKFKIIIIPIPSASDHWIRHVPMDPEDYDSYTFSPENIQTLKSESLLYLDFECFDAELDGFLCREYGNRMICLGNEFLIDGAKKTIVKISKDGIEAIVFRENGESIRSFYSNNQIREKSIGYHFFDNIDSEGRVEGRVEGNGNFGGGKVEGNVGGIEGEKAVDTEIVRTTRRPYNSNDGIVNGPVDKFDEDFVSTSMSSEPDPVECDE